ncbi:MAG: glucose-6-phosphate isomerase [Gammaproteobacteria bacterium]|nr:glucose-6-phosphate isomerase [Gammaproteobacteria bacterium]
MDTPSRHSTELPSWQRLETHAEQLQGQPISSLFKEDPDRFDHFSARFEGILLDYSKNRLTKETRTLLVQLAEEAQLPAWRERMFRGEKINHTEERAVLHTALRAPETPALMVEQEDVMPAIHQVLEQMARFVDSVHQEEWLGCTGVPITDIVNIGIGGSDLGPRMVVDALRPWQKRGIRSHFVSNLDGRALETTLESLDATRTLFIVASKTFTTLETMTNAHSARNWFLQAIKKQGKGESSIRNHFVAVSSNPEACQSFGIAVENVFTFWDWVGGRLSLWSAIGLSIALAIGMDRFRELMAGAHAMDNHFRSAPLEENLPVLLALIGVWNHNFQGAESHAVIPYDASLELFPAYLQQLDMESNGKQVDREGEPIEYLTSPLLWGESGSNGQHSFFQFLHQSSIRVPIDFIGTLEPGHQLPDHHERLTANMLAQAEALMKGKSFQEALAEISAQPDETQTRLARYKTFPGNLPSNMLLLERLDPHTLGSLIALYEHKIFIQGVIWNLNSFDQMGVELGKALAKRIQQELEQGALDKQSPAHDSSTQSLINYFLQHKNRSQSQKN